MSGLAEKVREKVRGRSRSSRPTHENDGSVPELPPVRTSQNYTDSTAPRVSSPTIPAWHVSTGGRNSNGTQSTVSRPTTGQYESLNASRGYNHPSEPYSYRHMRNAPSDPLPPRTTSLQQGTEVGDQTRTDVPNESGLQYPYTVPRRKESLPQNRASKRISVDRRRSPQQHRNLEQEPSYQQGYTEASAPPVAVDQTRTSIDLPEQRAGQPLGTEIDQALASLHMSDDGTGEQNRQANSAAPTNGQVLEDHEHVRVPQGFDLGKSERTIIDTEWKPAVTHENVYHEKTEIIQEAITRDIHVHHYYTYVQPIKVVEVLPAKHYIIDERTGLKLEIEAPPGWVMPEDLQPRVEDTSAVKGWTRHYLVNEEYPYGVPEHDPQTIPRKPVNWHTQPHGTAGEYMEY